MQLFTARSELKGNYPFLLFLLGLYVFCGTILLKPSINSIAIGIIITSILINKDFYRHIKTLIHHPVVYCFLIFYFLHMLSVFNSANVDRAFKDLVLKLPLVVIPLGFRLYKLTVPQIERFLNLFIIVVVVFSAYCLIATFITMLHGTNPKDFFVEVKTIEWGYFSYILPVPINGHAPYLSLYAGTGAFICVYFLYKYFAARKAVLWLYFFAFVYLFSFVILLSSRTSFVVLTFTLTLWMLLILIQKNKIMLALASSLTIMLVAFFALSFIPYLNNKIKNLDGLEERKIMWRAGAHIIQENIVFGVGTGDIKESLLEEYRRLKFKKGIQDVYNAHNQYFQTTIGLGLIGLIGLFSLFFIILYFSWISNNYFLISFTIVFVICSLTESLLSRQSGVVIFSFMVGIWLNSFKKVEV